MAVKSITVTELKHACLDKDWKDRWLAGENPQTTPLHPPNSIAVYGTKFHNIVKKFLDWLSLPENNTITLNLKDRNLIWDEMYTRFAESEINEVLNNNRLESAHYLANALKAFCDRTVTLRDQTNNFHSWNDIYITNEFHIKDIQYKVGDHSVFVSGQLDLVRVHPARNIEIVDYKLTKGDNREHDLLQLAIYAELLKKLKPEMKCNGAVEYYAPDLREVVVTHKELAELFHDSVLPVLHELAGKERSKCARVNKKGIDGFAVIIKQTYADFGLKIEIVDKQEAPQLVRYKIKPDSGVKVVSLANRADDLQVALSLNSPPRIEPSVGYVSIDIPKETPDVVYWNDREKNPDDAKENDCVSFPIGVGVNNEMLFADFADSNMAHALVAGAAGSGKSEFLKSLVGSLLKRNSPETLRLSLIDPKILTFGSLKTSPFLAEPVIYDVTGAIACLEKAVHEMENRYKQLADEGFNDLSNRIKAGRKDIPFYIILFDEFADLVLQGKKEKEVFEKLVARLAAKGRAAGIHVVLATQRPDRNIVTGIVKANLPLKICMKVTTATNSKIILDHAGGELLLGRGDLLCDRGKGIERAQSLYISQDELLSLAKIC
ncbi:MAG: cell division protein FtsK [Candidatus Kuenenia sp.]|nr:cell division protein FtsK [Candidatus Kuenenia hertensis]